jgi:hypothetical protein
MKEKAFVKNKDSTLKTPPDFMLELTKEEYHALRCQFGTLKRGEHSKYLPMAFTEEGVAMLSSVLNSKRAIEVNILIMRAFVRVRHLAASHKDLLKKIEEMEKKYDRQFQVVFEAIKQLMLPGEKARSRIGFQLRDKRAAYSARGWILVGSMKSLWSRIRMRTQLPVWQQHWSINNAR